AGRVAGTPRLDTSMDAALLLTALASRAGDRTDFLAFDRRGRGRGGGAPRRAGPSPPPHARAGPRPPRAGAAAPPPPRRPPAPPRRRSLVVLLTDLNPAAVEEGLLPRLPLLTARNQVLVAAVADPALAELAARRADAGQVYGAAAAEQARSARQRVSALLQRR